MTLTSWGYSISEEPGNFITTEEYDAYTGGKYTGDVRIDSGIISASQAIRNYCGWHIYPSLECCMKATFFDKRVSRVDGGMLIQLPAAFVSRIISVRIAGSETDKYFLETNGILRIYELNTALYAYSEIEVVYMAGIPDGEIGAVRELTATLITHALAQSYGVTSEAAGGVSVTYNNSYSNGGQAGVIDDYAKGILTHYRLQGVF
ncbi:MAG: hypothetical protein IJV68_05150 [Clostridia bacterium]|nr:hypothetical protein [Clostridia bacterium]